MEGTSSLIGVAAWDRRHLSSILAQNFSFEWGKGTWHRGPGGSQGNLQAAPWPCPPPCLCLLLPPLLSAVAQVPPALA